MTEVMEKIASLDDLLKNRLTAHQYEHLDELIGISPHLLTKYKTDPLRIPAEHILKIAEICGCTEQEVIDSIKAQSSI